MSTEENFASDKYSYSTSGADVVKRDLLKTFFFFRGEAFKFVIAASKSCTVSQYPEIPVDLSFITPLQFAFCWVIIADLPFL